MNGHFCGFGEALVSSEEAWLRAEATQRYMACPIRPRWRARAQPQTSARR